MGAFTKYKKTGEAHAYKKVTDWDAVWGAVFLVVVGLVILANL